MRHRWILPTKEKFWMPLVNYSSSLQADSLNSNEACDESSTHGIAFGSQSFQFFLPLTTRQKLMMHLLFFFSVVPVAASRRGLDTSTQWGKRQIEQSAAWGKRVWQNDDSGVVVCGNLRPGPSRVPGPWLTHKVMLTWALHQNDLILTYYNSP